MCRFVSVATMEIHRRNHETGGTTHDKALTRIGANLQISLSIVVSENMYTIFICSGLFANVFRIET